MRSMGRHQATVVVAGCLLALAGCGDGGGTAGSLAQWEERHGGSVAALDRELAAADAALDAGDRDAILDACNLLDGAVRDVRDEALPVPDTTADEALQAAVADIDAATEACLSGGRSGAAADVEAAMALVDEARESLTRARSVLDASSS